MAKPALTVVLGKNDAIAQREHLARGALFLPEPAPPPEPFAEVLLRVVAPSGAVVEIDARVLQILSGRGIAVAPDDLPRAKASLAPIFDDGAAPDAPTTIAWGTGAGEATEASLEDEADRDESAQVRDAIAKMSTNEKMQLALKGDRLARLLLLKDANKNLQTFVLQNPRLTLDEVRYLAGFRQASPDVLLAIAAHRDWMGNPGVVAALIRNPKTPGPTAVKLLDKVPMAEIRRLAKSTDVPQAVQAAARKRVASAAG